MADVVQSTEPMLPPIRARSKRLNVSKAQRMYDQGLSTYTIGKLEGVNQKTVWRHLQLNKPERQALHHFKANRADTLAKLQAQSLELQAQVLESMKDRDIVALTPQQKSSLLIALNAQHGTLYDKERLERNLSTSNQSIISQMLNTTVTSLYKPVLVSETPKRKSKQSEKA